MARSDTKNLLLTIFIVWLNTSKGIAKELRVCSSNMGCVIGKYMAGYDTDKFEAYVGIPYALPPINELRFSSPKAYPKWSGDYNATTPKMDCIQKNILVPNAKVEGVEDCLYLNVYKPVTNCSRDLLPVMVYIFGGGWFSGTSNQGPEYFMDTKEVLLVTFNYRLGPLGFLSTNDIHMPGNFGLKDQLLALRWIKKNIFAFGGNPKKMTVFGQSAGAISAHLLLLSKQSEGLFHNVIAISGVANVPFAINESPLEQALELARLCNITETSTAKLTRALRRVDAAALVNAGDGLKYWDVDPVTVFKPVVESSGVSDAVLTQHPEKILSKGRYNAVPWMTGFVPQEGAVRGIAILENERLKSSFNKNFDYLLMKLMDLPKHFNHTQLSATVNNIIDEYFDGQHELNNENKLGLLEAISDRGFLHPLYNVIETYVNTIDTEKYPVYLYNFDYRGSNTFANIYTGGVPSQDYGVVHCDDLIYLFRSPDLFPDFPKNSTDAAVMRALVGYFVHFAKFSTPLNINLIEPCSRETFSSAPNTICDYDKFVNTNSNSFEIRTEKRFPVQRVKYWNNLLAQ